MPTTLGRKDIGVRKLELVARTQFLFWESKKIDNFIRFGFS